MTKQIDIVPVTGYMDLRSAPADVPFGGYRLLQNCWIAQKDRLQRSPGFDKLLTRDLYNNYDLHDQLLTLSEQVNPNRDPITFLFEALSSRKTSKLLAATDTRVYALSMSTGNWKIISDRLGTSGKRWYGAALSDTVVLTNDWDPPQVWDFDQPASEPHDQSVRSIPDLGTAGVSRAGVVVQWRGLMFLMNLVQDGQVFSNRLMWSDFNKPTAFIPTGGSLAGNHDLDFGESILAAHPMGNVLLIYTTTGIWEVTVVGGEEILGFSKRYDPGRQGGGCLAYKNTIVSTGNQHIYLGHDGVYTYDIYHLEPTRTDWQHKGSSAIFDNLNKGACEVHNAGYNSLRKEVYISWATASSPYPDRTLVINTEFPGTFLLDTGFTAQATWIPREPITSIKDWLISSCICTPDAFQTEFGGLVKEGGSCLPDEPVDCPTPLTSIFSTEALTLEDGIVTEDYNQLSASANSICEFFAGQSISSICTQQNKSDECTTGPVYVVGSSGDYCLKQLSNSFYREVYTGTDSQNPCGKYERRGYRSILRSGPIALQQFKASKLIRRFQVEALPSFSTVPAQIKLRIGTSAQALDPNVSSKIKWEEQDSKDLVELGLDDEDQISQGVRNDETLEWPLYSEGYFVYFEITVLNDKSTPFKDTGGDVTFSRFSFDVDKIERSTPV